MLDTIPSKNGHGGADTLLPAPHRDQWGPHPAGTVSVVMPALNEERNIAWVLERMPGVVDEVILVDGRSVDGTVAVACAIRPDIVVVSEPRLGKGRALRAGFGTATALRHHFTQARGTTPQAYRRAFRTPAEPPGGVRRAG